jgi:shikimate dehydrogenase
MISARTRVFGLVGHPVRQSLSPAMYNELFRQYGLDAVYAAFDVHPDRAERVAEAMRTLDLVGVNLTVPFKERVVPHLDRVTLAAEEAGSVNVVTQVEGTLTGYNTDGEGLVRSLEEAGDVSFSGLKAVVLGAGGTGRAVMAALADRGAEAVALLNRTVERAEVAVQALAPRCSWSTLSAGALTAAAFAQYAEGAGLVVNCTAGGAVDLVTGLDPARLAAGATWVDVNYWMADPPQQARCAELGIRFHTGHAMLIHQGALSFELFTGHPVTAEDIRAFLDVEGE